MTESWPAGAIACESAVCGKPIRFALSDATGKWMPIDAVEVPDGNVAVRQDEPGGPLRCRSFPNDPRAQLDSGEKRTTSHYATCDDAGRFRRPERVQRLRTEGGFEFEEET